MALPFFPGGAITASIVLVGTIVLFRMLLLPLDRGAAELPGSIGPGLARGARSWVERPGQPDAATQAPPGLPRPGLARHRPSAGNAARGWSMPADVILEDLATPSGVGTEAVRPQA